MPDETNPKIDADLRAYARERREALGAPITPDGPALRALREEVARRTTRLGEVNAGWLIWWPRLAWGAAVAVFVAALTWGLSPIQQSTLMAKRSHVQRENLARSAGLTADNQPGSNLALTPLDQKAQPGRGETLSALADTAAPPPGASAGVFGERKAEAALGAIAIATSEPGENFVVISNQVAALSRTGAGGGQGPILQQFHLELTGDRVTLRDADGSIYLGHVDQTSNSKLGKDAQAAKPSVALRQISRPDQPQTAQGAGEFALTAEGTNLSTQQRVSFFGVLQNEGPPPAFANTYSEGSNSSRLRLQGQARIGGTNLPIDVILQNRQP